MSRSAADQRACNSPTRAPAALGFGAYPLAGCAQSDDQARACLRVARESGYGWVDSGEVYRETANESVLGRVGLDGLEIATKVAPQPAGSGLRPEQIHEACRKSLRRLRVEVIDWYYLHWPDPSIPVEESWGAMRQLVQQGLVRRAGLSNFGVPDMRRCLDLGGLDVVQLGFSLVDHQDARAAVRWCAEQGIPVTAYEPLANGVLSGEFSSSSDFCAWSPRDPDAWPFFQRVLTGDAKERTGRVLDVLRDGSRRLAIPGAQIALAWVLAQPGVAAVLPGSRSPDHIRSNAGAQALRLPTELLRELDACAGVDPQ